MLHSIIHFSLKNKFIILLLVMGLIAFGIFSLLNIPIGAVPDVTTNQVQVITTSRDLPTEEVERYLTYPVELEMANLPGVEEIRSISKFGLSVVTIVFNDDMGTYLPRQLIAERLKTVADQIPEGFGTPFMGPISTGLGEIYQYTLDVKPAHKDKYEVQDLRTIQDWIVKRQLSGIPGVVEVNTWGGFLKTYEVAVNPVRLQAMGITLTEVYSALTDNNSVAGGGYIEKSNEAFFIRADGLLDNIEDIENIVVTHKNKTPVFVKDVGKVRFGSATRFGAITGNGEGEKVLGQVMMLKGADSKKVIDAVIERVAAIQSTLPEGVFINPFLDRSELIGRTTFTIAENLIFGFLIVLFVVVFLLGDIRSGLVVASVIPLTLLFALMMMYLFGIDANLMSLGAIDFGIIIDGAVIIVEYIAFTINTKAGELLGFDKSKRQSMMNELVGGATNKMMHSAIFGQIIIIIVFIPILALAGIEGKMFRPMALTFCFALIGAMILCFTYVPVMASLFLKPKISNRKNISTRFIDFLKGIYQPMLELALQLKWLVVSIAVGLLLISALIFNSLGGEFVPTLDEGDFVIQPVLKTGMSLAETVKMTTRIEKILKRFPEVKQVVSRIGAAEVPTDPMSMEESDVIITLNKKSEWTSAASKDQLADIFKSALLEEIPGIEIEFTQPIEMRFNELISGSRSDLAIKLFGEDLEILYQKASEIENAISGVAGASDVSVEKIDGLPQMTVQYDRQKVARYGVNIKDLNDIINMGFAGKTAGRIFEGESQFDLVIKYDKEFRNNIDQLNAALVNLPSGQQLPLSAFADISYTTGPAKISRDDTKRRVVIGINVRGRDLQSVVDEVKAIIDSKITIPTGYFIQYGGQFENLQNASRRLLFAVPVALILIFILLYFAFHSIKEALLIYSAIPLATIGGILALYFRGMPFSISAGVGFIALFGIAVLNGIVMIEHFKELKSKGMNTGKKLIVTGAIDRLRPVLLTAFAAALGFLPMAISTSAGAEVQRPLATVVIGGLISATFLTLIILPVLYSIFEKNKTKREKSGMLLLIIPLLYFLPQPLIGQKIITVDEAIDLALENNIQAKTIQLEIDRQKALINGNRQINKTDFYYEFDQNNIAENGKPLHVIGVGQSFKLPTVNNSRVEAQQAMVAVATSHGSVYQYNLRGQIYALYDRIAFQQQLLDYHNELSDSYIKFLEKSEKKFNLGESNILEKLAAQQKKDDIDLLLKNLQWELQESYYELNEMINGPESVKFQIAEYQLLDTAAISIEHHPMLNYYDALILHSKKLTDQNATEKLPEINVSAFGGINGSKLYPGVQAGVAIPLAKSSYDSRAEADQIYTQIQASRKQQLQRHLKIQLEKIQAKYVSLQERIAHFENNIDESMEALITKAEQALNGGEIDYLQYLLLLDTARQSNIQKLKLIHEYNQTVIQLNYLLK